MQVQLYNRYGQFISASTFEKHFQDVECWFSFPAEFNLGHRYLFRSTGILWNSTSLMIT